MIYDDILGQKKRRDFEPTRKPILKMFREDPSNLDPELRMLRHVMVNPDNPDNREYCFWIDSISQSFSYITAATIIGDGLRIRCKNKQARQIIEEWNDEINVNGDSLETYVTSSWIDALIHSNSYWRIELNKDLAYKVDIQRMDPKTILEWKDRKYGWNKLIQKVGNYKSYRSKASFYARASPKDDIITTYPYTTKELWIPDEPDVVLKTSFFIRPPIAAATQFIAYKRFILYFMRKYSQKLWTPFILFLVGNPMTNYYYDEADEMQEAMNDVASIIPEMSNFGGAAMPGNVTPFEVGKGSAKNSEVFVTYMEFLDKQTMLATFGSMGIREASGNELSTQRGLMEAYLQFIKGVRRRYALGWRRFYTKCLLPQNGINLNAREIDIDWAPLKFEASEDYMKAVEIGTNIGAFKDRNEIRKACQAVYPWMEELVGSENKKVKFPVDDPSTMNRIKQFERTL